MNKARVVEDDFPFGRVLLATLVLLLVLGIIFWPRIPMGVVVHNIEPLVKVGSYVCRNNQGLQHLKLLPNLVDHYSFICRDDAVFAEVKVTLTSKGGKE